ncbi:MAG: hypothetical protein ACREDJ_02340 [Methylocella sp.]
MTEKNTELIILTPSELAVPPLVASAGERAARRFVEFFTANIPTEIRERPIAGTSTPS